MNRLFRIYRACVRTSFARTVAYLGNFYSEIVSSLMFTGLHLATILLLTSKVESVYGWSRHELILLTLVFNLDRALLEVFFYGGLRSMGEIIFKGDLDILLLKPVNSQFMISVRELRFPGIIRVIVSLALIVYVITSQHIQVDIFDVTLFVVLSLFALLLLYSLWFMATTLLIWNPVLTNMKDFLAYLTGLLRYPPGLFKEMGVVAFSIILPFLLVVAPSTLALLGKINLVEVVFVMCFSILTFYISQLFWSFALRHYTSASS